jgi:hypothetical protein
MATFTGGETFDYTAAGKQVTAARLNNHVSGATITRTSAGDTDNSTLEVSSNKYQVKDDGITNAKLANMADQTFKGNVSGGSANPSDLTVAQMLTALGMASLTNAVVQVVQASTNTDGSTTVAIPVDDTIPQNTEGEEILTATITPKSATNKLLIIAQCPIRNSTAPTTVHPVTLALFQDSTANALNAATYGEGTDNVAMTALVLHQMTAGTTSATTFKLRGGPRNTDGRLRWLQRNDGSGLFSTVANVTITIIEYT